MSYSDSDTSSGAGEYKNLKQITRERLLYEMLRSDSNSTSKVLIVDKVTLKIFGYCCKMPELTWEGVSLVEDIDRSRQPFPSLMDAIYFIQPTKENVALFLKDMSGSSPLYKKALVYFSSPIPRELVVHIKKDASVLPRIGALSEMNLEYFAVDNQSFITDNGRALEDLFGDEENSRKGDACLDVMATRIATVFASLREFPFVRYRAAKSLDPMTLTTFRDIIPTKLAAGIWNCLEKYKSKPGFPQKETCELLILDRSIDQIAPVIHEWTYEAMCHDLLNMEGNKYVREVPSKTGGPPDKKEVLLEENDPLWLELRHAHIAVAGEMLHEKMINFKSKNKSAQLQHGLREGELSTRELRKMVQALPQYSDQNDNLSLHVEITERIYQIIKDEGLRDLAQLEQDLVFGDAGIKDVIKFLSTNEKASRENKMRLLMILASIYPEKFEGEEGYNLMKLAKLPPEDMTAVNNVTLLAPPSSDAKKSSAGAFSWIFDVHKKKHAARKDRSGELLYSRFYPMIEELVEKLSKGELSKDDYPCINAPPIYEAPAARSMRSRRTPTWARSRVSDESVLRHTSSDFKRSGKRIFVFIVGGATRSELGVCRELTRKLNREVILGSTSLDDPPQFIKKMKQLSLDDLH